jgi:SMODS and SLOG-associating 2TM effector domain family 5
MTSNKIIERSFHIIEDDTYVQRIQIEKLCADIRSVYKSRFCASRRLEKFDDLSQWTVNSISLILILIPILVLSGVIKSDAYVNSYSAFSAVFILMFSIIQNSGRYSLRAHRMHECGTELNDLRRMIESKNMDRILREDFEGYSKLYSDILNDYENHEQIDYLTSEYEIRFSKMGAKRYFTLHYLRLVTSRLASYFRYYASLMLFLILPVSVYILHELKKI